MGNTIQFRKDRTADTTRRPSPAIWGDGAGGCPWRDIVEGIRDGVAYYTDFTDFPLPGTLTTEIALGRFKAFANTGCTISRIPNISSTEIPGGVLQFSIDTNNDAIVLSDSYPTFLMSGLTSNSGPLWFECCYAQNSIATNMASTFFGLVEVDLLTLSNTVPMNAGDPIDAAASMIGFRIEEDGLGVVDTVYSDRATSFTNIGDTEGGTLAANTFKKFGFVYDPYAPAADRVKFYQDNQITATRLSHSTLTGLTNLDANLLGFLWGSVADTAGTSFKGWMKWVRIAQLFP